MRTRCEAEKAAHVLGDDRWNVWMKCGLQKRRALRRTDSSEHYCENCCAIERESDGADNPVAFANVRAFVEP